MDAQLIDRIAEAADYVRKQAPAHTPDVGIIFGTGLSSLRGDVQDAVTIPYGDIPHFVTSTVESHAGELVLGRLEGQTVVAMRGRFHAYEGYSFQDITFPVRVMKALGIDKLIVSNACGGLNPQWQRGDIMIIEDHINMMGGNPLVGVNDERLGPRFPDMCEPYSRRLMTVAKEAVDRRAAPGAEGCVCFRSRSQPGDARRVQDAARHGRRRGRHEHDPGGHRGRPRRGRGPRVLDHHRRVPA